MPEKLTLEEEREIRKLVENAFKIFEPLATAEEDRIRVENLKERMIETRRAIKLFLKNLQSK